MTQLVAPADLAQPDERDYSAIPNFDKALIGFESELFRSGLLRGRNKFL